MHPWLGKRLVRTRRRGGVGPMRNAITKTYGTLTEYDQTRHYVVRGLSRATPGELFVLSNSGKSAYAFTDGRGAQLDEWSLAE